MLPLRIEKRFQVQLKEIQLVSSPLDSVRRCVRPPSY